MDLKRGCGVVLGCLGITVFLGTLGALVSVHLGGSQWNGGDPPVPPPTVEVWIEGHEDAAGKAAARAVFAELEARCSASTHGVRVLFDQLWYNTMTSGYEGRVWIDDARGSTAGLYLWGDRVVYRQLHAPYRVQILACEMDAMTLKRLSGTP